MERTAAQAKADNIAKMGDELGATYSALWREVAWIHVKWDQYVTLFGTNPTRIDLLNQAAPSLFRTVQDTLWEHVVLHLARLTDRPNSMGRPNLSVQRLLDLTAGSPAASEVEVRVRAVLTACEFARDWRNRRFAHHDLDLALERNVQPLAPASRTAVKAALASLADLLNAVSNHFLDSTTMFEIGSTTADAEALLYCLRDGLAFDEDRFEKVKRGELSPGALTPEPI